jgi:hypothetical protein
MLMTKRHWLLADHIGLREVRRALNGGEHPEESSEHEDRAKNTEAGERIGAWMKDLSHTSSRCPMRQRGNLDHPYIPWKDKGVTTPAKTYCRAVYHLLEACHVKNRLYRKCSLATTCGTIFLHAPGCIMRASNDGGQLQRGHIEGLLRDHTPNRAFIGGYV